MASLLTAEFVAADGLPADPDAQRELLAGWHPQDRHLHRDGARRASCPASRRRPHRRRRAAAGWTLAVASTSAEASVRAVLEHVAGADAARFAVLAGDVVAHKKPAPDIYLLALERLGRHAAIRS